MAATDRRPLLSLISRVASPGRLKKDNTGKQFNIIEPLVCGSMALREPFSTTLPQIIERKTDFIPKLIKGFHKLWAAYDEFGVSS